MPSVQQAIDVVFTGIFKGSVLSIGASAAGFGDVDSGVFTVDDRVLVLGSGLQRSVGLIFAIIIGALTGLLMAIAGSAASTVIGIADRLANTPPAIFSELLLYR